ncbi:MAG: SLC13 family permease [Methanobacteriota archaeon]
MVEKGIALGILIIVYALMISEKVHRTVAVLMGAAMMVGLGIVSEFQVIKFIHWEALGLIFGMFIIVGALAETGFFRWVGLHALKFTKFNPLKIFILFSVISALLAAFMDSITVMIFMATLTIEACRVMDVKPIPFLIAQIASANIGGAATMVGDPPNVLIGTTLGYSFMDFVVNVGPIAIVLFIVNIVLMRYIFRKSFIKHPVDMDKIYKEHAELVPFSAVKDVRHMRITLAIFAFTVTMLVLHQFLDMVVATVAMIGATLVLLAGGPKAPELVEKIDWHTILFLAGLFIVVGGLDAVGLLTDFARFIVSSTGGNPIIIVSALLWVFAPISAFLDNVPFAAAMIPVIKTINETTGMPLPTLAWTLAIVADVSGNATPIGSSASVVGVSVAKREGIQISWKEYCRTAFPAMLVCIAVANVMIVAIFLL